MKLTKSVIWQGGRWTKIEKENNKHMHKAGFVILRRPVSYSRLQRQGQMATAIDACWSDLVKKYPRLSGITL
jgi:hypothetical protein